MWFLYIPPCLTFQKSSMMLTLRYVFVQILEQTASFTLYIINWLVLFRTRGGECLLHSTH